MEVGFVDDAIEHVTLTVKRVVDFIPITADVLDIEGPVTVNIVLGAIPVKKKCS